MAEETESVRADKSTRDLKQREGIDWRGKNFKQFVYAYLYENNVAGTNLVLTVAGTFYQWVSSTVGEESGIGYAVGSATSDNITIGVSGEGIYYVNVHTCFGGDNNSTIHGIVYKNGAATILQFHRKLGGADQGSASTSGLLSLVAGDVLDLRYSSDGAATTMILHHIGLTLVRISA